MNKVVILAAGKGKRMGSRLPKVLVEVRGRPMLERMMLSVRASGTDECPVVVVSENNQAAVRAALKDFKAVYSVQKEQLGTAHAVLSAKDDIGGSAERVIVLNGDHPFVRPESIKLLAAHESRAVVMMTTVLPDYDGWRKNFIEWGRIVREDGKIRKIVEYKDADEETKRIREVNPAMYSFDRAWLWENIGRINSENAQKEFYLTDLIKLASSQGSDIGSVSIEPGEAMGINSKEELETAEKLMMDF